MSTQGAFKPGASKPGASKPGAITLGTHLAALSSGWKSCGDMTAIQEALAEAESLNYRVIEVPLDERLFAGKATPLRTRERATRLWAYTALPAHLHLPECPEHARAWIGRALAWCEAAGVSLLGGALGWSPGMLTPEDSVQEAQSLMVEVLADAADEAQRRGIRLAIEPANRYETNLCNTLAEGEALRLAIGKANMCVLANTWHMHMEEASLAAGIQAAREGLIGVHLVENTGGGLTSGAIAWEAIWQALGEINFQEALIVTPWSAKAAQAMQQKGVHSAASDALRFLRAGVRAMQPPASRKSTSAAVAELPKPKPKRKRSNTKSYR